jgi:deazaflavin-dependent oxidoreductase (nitroreductase family)
MRRGGKTEPSPGTRGRIPPAIARILWRLFNPVAIALASWIPAWAVLETTGRLSGRRRRTPVARTVRGTTFWVIAVHGRHASFVRNIADDPRVRVRIGRRWRPGLASIGPMDEEVLRRANIGGYAQAGPPNFGWDPVLVRIDLGPNSGEGPRGDVS